MNQDEQNESEWRNSDNWKPVIGHWLTMYAGRKDRQIIVPKRDNEIGFTINAGHPFGKAILLIIAIMLPLVIASAIILGIVLPD